MNKFIKKQLEKITCCEISKNHYISKSKCDIINNKNDLEVGNKYKIKVENYIVNPPANFTLSSNWNNNTVPPEHLLDIEVLQIMGKMIRCKCVGCNTNIEWEGWIPRKSMTII